MTLPIRIMLCIVALPGLFLMAIQLMAWYLDGTQADFDLFFFGYGLVACYLVFLAFTSKSANREDRQS